MNQRILLIGTIAAGAFLPTGCFDKEVDKIRGELAETRKMVERVAKEATRAVPGERYLQLIDDLNGKDDAKRAAAQEFLRNLGRIDITTTQEVSVWFQYDKSKKLRAQIVRAASPDRAELETVLASTHIYVRDPIGSSNFVGRTEENLKQFVEDRLRRMVDEMRGPGVKGEYTIAYGQNLFSSAVGSDVQEIRKKLVVDAARDAIMAIYSNTAYTDNPDFRLSLPWNVLDKRQWIFVLLRREDWEACRENLEIRVLVHDRTNRTGEIVAPPGQPAFRLIAADFAPDLHQPIRHDVDGEIVWAVLGPTENGIITDEQVANRRALLKTIEEWERSRLAPKNL